MKWLILLSLVGCAQVTSLNLKKHQFGLVPTKIIWFQVAGLEEEQIAMLRFQQSGETTTSFEKNICIGKTWNYNLYKIRNSAESTFLSQMTGKKNVKSSCDDLSLKPIWNYIYSSGYETGVIETGASPEQSLTRMTSCPGGLDYMSTTFMWSRSEVKPGADTFHYSDEIKLNPGRIYYDRACGKENCTSSVEEDFSAIYGKIRRESHKHLLIVRDFSYLKALEKKDFNKAKEILMDLEEAYARALEYTTNNNDYLVLLTSGDSRFVDMPDQGKNWFEYAKDNKNISVKRPKLTNIVLASGSRAENFCGIYDDSEVFERILSGPKQQGLELKIINPFK